MLIRCIDALRQYSQALSEQSAWFFCQHNKSFSVFFLTLYLIHQIELNDMFFSQFSRLLTCRNDDFYRRIEWKKEIRI